MKHKRMFRTLWIACCLTLSMWLDAHLAGAQQPIMDPTASVPYQGQFSVDQKKGLTGLSYVFRSCSTTARCVLVHNTPIVQMQLGGGLLNCTNPNPTSLPNNCMIPPPGTIQCSSSSTFSGPGSCRYDFSPS